jgi:CRP-like cAMP-binding protein
MREATYRAGEVIFAEGDYSTDAYIVKRGRVEVYVTRATDRPLAVFHDGAVFGELSLLTDQVRTASARALEDTSLIVISQDGFLELWRRDPDVLLPLLRVIFERVRDITSLANELSLDEHNRAMVTAHAGGAEPITGEPPARIPHVVIEGATPAAREALDDAPLVIARFPFRIGGDGGSDRLFVNNDLVLTPTESSVVARNHCMLINVNGRCFVVDRGSRMGTFVDGVRVGQPRSPSRVELAKGRSELAVAGPRSAYRFHVTVKREASARA